MFLQKMVEDRKYLSRSDFMEIFSLCQMLPGPTSTQTITAIGYKFGGPRLAFLTLIIWLLPATILMSFFSLSYTFLDRGTLSVFKYIQPMAVAFIIIAAIHMVQNVARTKLSVGLMIFAFTAAALLRHPAEEYFKTPWIFPIILFLGGLFSYWYHDDIPKVKKTVPVKVNWKYFIIFASVFVGIGILAKVTKYDPVILFENNYRFGTLVFGGGNVLIPMMFEQFVKFREFLTAEEFITGVGLVQAVPGPVFSVSTYTTGLALKDMGLHWHLAGCLIGTAGIVLPGMLLIFFLFPVWNQVKHFSIIQRSLSGVIASSAGLVAAAAYLLFLPVGLRWKEANNFYYTNLADHHFVNWQNIIVIAVLSFILYRSTIPSPVWVLMAIVAGIFI
jgi:chromate transporter